MKVKKKIGLRIVMGIASLTIISFLYEQNAAASEKVSKPFQYSGYTSEQYDD